MSNPLCGLMLMGPAKLKFQKKKFEEWFKAVSVPDRSGARALRLQVEDEDEEYFDKEYVVECLKDLVRDWPHGLSDQDCAYRRCVFAHYPVVLMFVGDETDAYAQLSQLDQLNVLQFVGIT